MQPNLERDKDDKDMSRRDFVKIGCKIILGGLVGSSIIKSIITDVLAADNSTSNSTGNTTSTGYNQKDHFYGYVIDTRKCIGCGRCANACKLENKVPFDESVYRTWVERYRIVRNGDVKIDSPNGGINGFTDDIPSEDIKKAFYTPKMCNHCENPPCVQVCPVGATFSTEDGVVLVDYQYCIGCRYCIQGCPYGARYFNSAKRTADKCTWCYHRITKGLLPACVEACPVGARQFGDLKDPDSIVNKILDKERINVLKPDLGTKPKAYYVGLDIEVR